MTLKVKIAPKMPVKKALQSLSVRIAGGVMVGKVVKGERQEIAESNP